MLRMRTLFSMGCHLQDSVAWTPESGQPCVPISRGRIQSCVVKSDAVSSLLSARASSLPLLVCWGFFFFLSFSSRKGVQATGGFAEEFLELTFPFQTAPLAVLRRVTCRGQEQRQRGWGGACMVVLVRGGVAATLGVATERWARLQETMWRERWR